MKQITFDELNEIITNGLPEGKVIVDVREKDEYAGGHVPGALNAPMSILKDKHSDYFDKSKEYYVICQSGGRSMQVCVFLNQFGIDVTNVQGGTGSYGSKYALER